MQANDIDWPAVDEWADKVDSTPAELMVVDPTVAIEKAADPAEFVVQCLTRGKSWLTEALAHGDLEALANVKGWAATLRTATMQKQLGKDAEIAATELVRRAERAIGLGIRAAQEAGEINAHGRKAPGQTKDADTASLAKSPYDYADHTTLYGDGKAGGNGAYALADDVTDEQFEQAIEEAKEEGNMSRANVVRHVKAKPSSNEKLTSTARELAATGHTISQIASRLGYSREGMRNFLKKQGIEVPAEAVVGRQRNLDSTRIVSATVDTVNGIGSLFDRIVFADLDPEDVDGWLPVLNDSIRSLTTLRNRLKEVASRV